MTRVVQLAVGALLFIFNYLIAHFGQSTAIKKENQSMGSAIIGGIVVSFMKDALIWYLEMTGKTEITLADLKAKTPDELLKEVGVTLD